MTTPNEGHEEEDALVHVTPTTRFITVAWTPRIRMQDPA